MKILMANKFYYLKGGAERYLFNLQNLLEGKGHQVIPFAMRDRRNVSSSHAAYFVSPVDISSPQMTSHKLKTAGRLLYSREARKKIALLVTKTKPDLAHIHNIYHQLSPSILPVLKKKNIPIVMTVHDFKLMCPVYLFYTQGEICERCKKYRYYQCVLHRCAKNSYTASALNMVEMYLHKLWRIYDKNIDLYICPSQFVKQKMIEFGFIENKIRVLSHFVDFQPVQQVSTVGDYLLYFGRLSKEKGVGVLLRAMKNVKNITLKIAGSGPDEKELKQYVAQENLDNIRFLGHLSGESLTEAIQNALCAVIPSISYETFGFSVAEAYVHGKPVVAANIGALPEIVKDGQTGFLFKSGDSQDLAEKINKIQHNQAVARKMGERGQEYVEKYLGAEQHYRELIEIYKKLL